jgi:hypothetical protein
MTTSELGKFWGDIALAYTQVALNHERKVEVYSEAEDLTAYVEYDSIAEKISVSVFVGRTDTPEDERNL